MIVGFSSNVKQAALSSTRNVNSVCSPLSGGEEMRLESFGPLSLFDCGAHVVRLGPMPADLRGPGTHKSSLGITGQTVPVQPADVSRNLPCQPSGKMAVC